jgi:uncharacterized protein
MNVKMVSMKRIYEQLIQTHLQEDRQMVFLAGPRQVGKTTCGLHAEAFIQHTHYLNWDNADHQKIFISGPAAVVTYLGLQKTTAGLTVVIFDELHKYGKWKQFLKGFFDTYGELTKIIVTGSAKMDIYRKGGDSLIGRYFLYRIHPITLGELASVHLSETEIRPPHPIAKNSLQKLLTYGGFPEPLIKENKPFLGRWRRLRQQLTLQEDIRQMGQIQEWAQFDMLAQILKEQAGQLTSYTTLANTINMSVPTVQRWLKNLEAFYYCFTIRPWHKNVKRSLRKEPKLFLWDWSLVNDIGKRYENFVASHLLKAVHFWTDCGLGTYDLYFLRDKEKREVDFLVTKDQKPWFLVEVKASQNTTISKNLHYFQQQTQAKHAFQVVFDRGYIEKNCFAYTIPVIVSVETFFSQLV